MKRTAARWRGASQASCDCLPPADPHRRRPRPLGLGQSSPVAEGLAPWSESMTTPSTRSRREPGCHQGRQPLHRHGLARSATASSPRPGSTTRPCHGRVAWAAVTLSPVADVGPARPDASLRQPAPGPARAAAGPSATTTATAAEGGPGSGASREAGPAPRLDPPARPAIALRLAGRADECDHTHRPDGCPSNRRRGGSRWVGVGRVVRSGGPCWCQLGLGVGQRDRWVWQR